jgi:hypothetical protein
LPTRLPRRPPPIQELLERCGGLQETQPLLTLLASEAAADRYLHWDELRHRTSPQGLSHEQWWLAEKLSRRPTPLPLLASDGQAFWFSQPPVLLQGLHQIDRQAGASVVAPEAVTTRSTRDRYLLSSLMEDSITSSQMEGAATTRDVAKAMIRSRRPPRDRSERMILNNFLTMQRIREHLWQAQLAPLDLADEFFDGGFGFGHGLSALSGGLACLIKFFQPFQPVLAGFTGADHGRRIRDFAIDSGFGDVALGFDTIQLGTTPAPSLTIRQGNIRDWDMNGNRIEVGPISIEATNRLLELCGCPGQLEKDCTIAYGLQAVNPCAGALNCCNKHF